MKCGKIQLREIEDLATKFKDSKILILKLLNSLWKLNSSYWFRVLKV